MHRFHRLPILVAVSVVAITGQVACGSDDSGGDDSKYGFGEAEMAAAITGTWVGTLSLDGKEATSLTFELQHDPQAAVKPACGNRSFLNATCLDISSLQLVGKLSTDDATYQNTPVTGWFNVYGVETMGAGELELTLPNDVRLSAESVQGSFNQGMVMGQSSSLGKFTLRRP